MSPTTLPVVFIHGLWLHATSWSRWCDLFEAEGYAPIAPGWPNEPATVAAARADSRAVANQSIDDIVTHMERVIAALSSPPILIGHSFGGLIAEKLIGMGIGRAAIAIDPAQIKGVLPLPLAQLRSALPALANPLNLTRAVSLTKTEFRYGFGNALSEQESDELYDRWTIPSPARPLFQAAVANFVLHAQSEVDTRNSTRGPLLLISGMADHTVPDVTTRAAYRQYRGSASVTELRQFQGRGHSLTVDSGWEEVARTCLDWLEAQGLGAKDRKTPSNSRSSP